MAKIIAAIKTNFVANDGSSYACWKVKVDGEESLLTIMEFKLINPMLEAGFDEMSIKTCKQFLLQAEVEIEEDERGYKQVVFK